MKPFLKLVAEDIKSRFADDLSDIAIIFNNKRPITYLKKYLADTYNKSIWSPQFYTIQDFFSLSSNREQVTDLTQFFYLFELHNSLLSQEGVQHETLEEFYPLAEIILSDFSQLDYDLINIDQVYADLHETTLIDIEFQYISKEQQKYLQEFWQSFQGANQTAVQERFLKLWKRLPKLYRSFKERLNELNQTNISSIYRNLGEGKEENKGYAEKFKKLLFVGFNALSKVETLLFKEWQAEGKALFYFDIDDYYFSDKMQEAGLFLRRNIVESDLQNALNVTSNIIGEREDPIQIYATTGKLSQTKLLHDILIEKERDDYSSAILLADETLLIPLLQSLPDIKVNITTGFPLSQSSVFGLLDLWMQVQQEVSHLHKTKIPYQFLETFLNSPLTQVSKEEKKTIQSSYLKNQSFEIPTADIVIKSTILDSFFKPIKDEKQLVISLIEIIDKLLSSLGEKNQMKQIDANLLIETKKILNQLQIGFSSLPKLSIVFQLGLIRKAISSITSAIEGDPLKGIQIMGLLESRCLNFDHVYILGANEGILPKTSNSHTFLPNNIRKAYGLPVTENQDALSAYLFYRHFQYSKSIHLFYNSNVDEYSTGEESRFIRQLEFESKFKIQKYYQQQSIRLNRNTEELIITKTGAVWEKMYNLYVKGDKKLSATALTTYLYSPLQFFIKYVAEIEEPPSISQEFEINKLGNVIHDAMEVIYTPYKMNTGFVSTKVLENNFNSIDSLIAMLIHKNYNTGHESLDDLNGLQRIMHKIASEYVKMFLEYDIQHYTSFRIIELENKDKYRVKFPIQIKGKEEYLTLYGIIDRIDEVVTNCGEIKTRIVDYKTGGDSISFSEIEKVFSKSTENKALVQTLFYGMVYEQVTGNSTLEPHLYVARKMREEGTLFKDKFGRSMEGAYLKEQKENFYIFLKTILEEIFNPEIPFRHNQETKPYPSDPFTIFYQNSNIVDSDY